VSNTIGCRSSPAAARSRSCSSSARTPAFIRLPLVIEGLLHGLAGGALAGVCLLLASRSLDDLIRTSVPMLVPYLAPVDDVRLGLVLVGAGALLGAGGAWMSIRRYLRVG
jgi:cell division transport system permease protein